MASGRRKKQAVPPREATAVNVTPFWKRPWPWLLGMIAGLALLLTNVTSILSNARALPGEVRKTSDQFSGWYGDYQGWKGRWTNDLEGMVDAAGLSLSSQPFRIDIDDTASGDIVGTLETKGICDKLPLFENLLVDGSISSSKYATIHVFDFIGGYRREFAVLRLEREGQVMRVTPLADHARVFARESRIARDPEGIGGPDNREAICPGKRAKFIERALEKASKSSAQP